MNFEREDIEFVGKDDILLRDWLYGPLSSTSPSAIIMTHGFAALQEMGKTI